MNQFIRPVQITPEAHVRWIVLSHDDHDHTGNLEAAVEHFPNATVVASWWMTERLTGSIELDPRRMRWVVSGDTLDIGDRTLVFQRPPIFDSPTTRAVFDPSTGPVYEGAHIDRAIELLRSVPAGPAVPQPGQADLDAIVASMLVAA